VLDETLQHNTPAENYSVKYQEVRTIKADKKDEEEEDERRGSIDPEALALKWLMDDKKRRDDLENVLLKFV
jgi:hypothetical protein